MKYLSRKLHHIAPKDIRFDKANPRGESASLIKSDPSFKQLAGSIKSYGILEPIIVRETESEQTPYRLIDGERRLRAALVAKEKDVPTLIAKSEADGRILAYQIHMLRKNWSKVAETHSIRRIIQELKAENPALRETEIITELETITNHKRHEIDDIMRQIENK